MSAWPTGRADAVAVCPRCGGLAEVLLSLNSGRRDAGEVVAGHCLARHCAAWFSLD